jgi:hypothetical protein
MPFAWDVLHERAAKAAQARRWRQSADIYRKAYECSPDNWLMKFCCISGFTSILAEESTKPSDDDMAFLKSLGSDVGSSPLVRSKALFCKGLMHFSSSDRERAARSYRKALRIASGATAAERSVMVILPPSGPQPSGPLMDDIANTTRTNLAVIEGKFVASRIDRPMFRPVLFPLGPNATHADAEEMGQTLRRKIGVSGVECEVCHAPACEDGPKLLVCQGCLAARYCSKECQRAGWPAHKPLCGPIKAGDRARLCNLERALAMLNGHVVRVVRSVDSDGAGPPADRRWECAYVGGEAGRVVSVGARNLQRLRP